MFLGLAYVMWPAEFFQIPFDEITPGMLLRAVATLVLAALGIQFLCSLAIVTQSDR